MSTEYSHNIAMLVPEAQWAAAGAVIAIISGQQSDLLQFGSAKYLPDFDACNAQAKASHVAALQAAAAGQFVPQRPEWDVEEQIDMTAVQDLIDTMLVATSIPEGGMVPTGGVIIGIDIDAKALATACGLVVVPSDE